MWRFFLALVLPLWLGACSLPAPRIGEGLARNSEVSAAFDLQARFSLNLEGAVEGGRQFVGQLQWQHGPDGDLLLFSDPLGQGVAELHRPQRGLVLLRLADGSERQAEHPDQLLGDALGAPLPLDRLVAWVQGRPAGDAEVQQDALGRPLWVREGGWTLAYRYGDGNSPWPARLDVSLPGVLALRLSILAWEPLP